MSQSFNIAASGPNAGFDALLGGASAANDAPDGLFSSLVSLLGGNNGPKMSDLVQVGSPSQTGEAWLNLQLGDASVSLSAEALTTAMSPEKLASMVPGILDDLNLDDAVLQGLTNLGQTVRSAIEQPALPATSTNATPNPQIANAVLSLQEAALATSAQSPDQASATVQSLSNAANAAPDLANNNSQILAFAKTMIAQQESAGTPLTLEQIATRDSLAAQLQRQLTTSAEQQQVRVAAATQQSPTQNPQANAATQNPVGFAAALSSLPFVQTREVQTMNDPLLVAQNAGASLGQTASQTEQSTLFQPVKAAYQSPQVNLPQMAVTIARNFNAGNNNFQIRLDPAELGRVNIHLSVDDKGVVNAKMLVERPETLQLLQQDARALERALSQAGLDGARASLEFSLKDNPFAGNPFNNPDDAQNPETQDQNGQNQPDSGPDTAIAAYQGTINPGGVSLWI